MILRPEHPKPQFQRENWMNLNGTWGFEIDNARSGDSRGLHNADAVLSGSICVPFCPQSKLSGVEHKDFLLGVWYQKKVTLAPEQCAGRVVLHFGAVDYECDVFVNGGLAGNHKGGFVSFCFDITHLVKAGENVITVFAKDDERDLMIPSGKQSAQYTSYGCYYTRTTGIWQTVWLEFTPKTYIKSVKYDTDVKNGILTVTADLAGRAELTVEAFFEGAPMGEAKAENAGGLVVLTIPLKERHLWELGDGKLYDLILKFGQDKVQSYFGLRSIAMEDGKFLFNGRSVFQRLVLDQGFYPDGVYTAPSDADLEKDIRMAMDMGFNGARAHEKIFEERWLYHCDKNGYLVWGEYPNWGLDHSKPEAFYSVIGEWLEELARDRNHPCIIGWCLFNETWNKNGHVQCDDLIRRIYHITKAIDPTRSCIDASGFFHVETDIYDVHDYEQDPAEFKRRYDLLMTENKLYEVFDPPQSYRSCYEFRQHWEGQPVFVSEYGGIRWSAEENDEKKSWGYGQAVRSEEEFKERFQGLTDALLDNYKLFGLCYTQLTDVEQEQNGLLTYDRKAKFDPAWVRSVLGRKAAIED